MDSGVRSRLQTKNLSDSLKIVEADFMLKNNLL
jgi:hypothetical protein